MIIHQKVPGMRFHSIRQIPKDTMAVLKEIVQEFKELLPFPVLRFMWVGSYPCERAELHSDVDLNLDVDFKSLDDKRELMNSINRDPEKKKKFDEAMSFIRHALDERLGVRSEITIEHPNIADGKRKRGYSILEDKWYNADDPTTLLDARKTGWGYTDDDGVEHPGEDYYAEEAKKLKHLPGFIDCETDQETAHYRKGK